MALPSGSLLTLTIEKLVPGGDGLARSEGKVIFVPGTLPGETVRARLTESKKDFARAKVEEIVAAAPGRVEPACPVAKVCGGCDWQHIGYEEQLRQKVSLSADALRRLGGIDFPGLAIEAGEPWGYRNRAQLHRDAQGRAGFLARGSNTLVAVEACPVADPALEPLLARKPAGRPSGPGPAGMNPAGPRSLRRYPTWAQGGMAASGETREDAEISVDILDRPLRFDLRCFFQSNVAMLAKLIPFALEGLQGKEAMDLYCGVGVFGAFLSERFTRITAVEENEHALAYARRNIAGAEHRFLCGKVEELAARGDLKGPAPEAVLVDPPRGGLEQGARDFLGVTRPERLVYVSCNPATLARDLKELTAKGFSLDALRLFDFYPQTAHVEAVARLSRAP
jgi:23S rRNA (uracil1939-C5)-methyltransferase